MDTSRLDSLEPFDMSKPKVTDEEILDAFNKLKEEKRKQWKARFGPDGPPAYVGCRREEIQDKVQELCGVVYSSSGFRNRLKKLVNQGSITKYRMYQRIVYYE